MRFRSAWLVLSVCAGLPGVLAACGSDDKPPLLGIDMGSPARRSSDTSPGGAAGSDAAGASATDDGGRPQSAEPDAGGHAAPEQEASVLNEGETETSPDAGAGGHQPAADAGAEKAEPATDASAVEVEPPTESLPGDASREGAAGGPLDAAQERPEGPCPGGMVRIEVHGGAPYCIDATEVTNQDYQRFLDARPASPPEGDCEWTKLFPAGNWPPADPLLPVTGINWCDARLYCQWANKRLCGRIGGGTNPTLDADDYRKSEWYDACSGGGKTSYPYGGNFSPGRCKGTEDGSDKKGDPWPEHDDQGNPAGQCEGAVPGLFNMSGNVWEWEDSCTASPWPANDEPANDADAPGQQDKSRTDPPADGSNPNDYCLVRGGSFRSDPDQLACNASPWVAFPLLTRGSSAPDIGFRCCY
jgi:formylglycine-generating enzyme required for sulfatase activity